MTQIFAYIPFINGVAADVAWEYPTAAKKIDEGASLTAVVTGSGTDLDKVAEEMTSIYSEVIKVDHADLA
jgi:electron transfer flavoprotein alpha subunit